MVGDDRVLLGSLMGPPFCEENGLVTKVSRLLMFAEGLSICGPRMFNWFAPLNGRCVPFLPTYSTLSTTLPGSSRSTPRLQLCSYGVRFAADVRSGPFAPYPTSFSKPSEFPAG